MMLARSIVSRALGSRSLCSDTSGDGALCPASGEVPPTPWGFCWAFPVETQAHPAPHTVPRHFTKPTSPISHQSDLRHALRATQRLSAQTSPPLRIRPSPRKLSSAKCVITDVLCVDQGKCGYIQPPCADLRPNNASKTTSLEGRDCLVTVPEHGQASLPEGDPSWPLTPQVPKSQDCLSRPPGTSSYAFSASSLSGGSRGRLSFSPLSLEGRSPCPSPAF